MQVLSAGVGDNVTCRPKRTLMVKTGTREPSVGGGSPLAASYSHNNAYFIEIQLKITMQLPVAVRSKA